MAPGSLLAAGPVYVCTYNRETTEQVCTRIVVSCRTTGGCADPNRSRGVKTEGVKGGRTSIPPRVLVESTP